MTQEFYSNGKLLLSGEYAVLDGALAWAIPTKFGQHLRISTNTSAELSWKSFDENGKVWFEGSYDINSLKELSASDRQISKELQNILQKARQLNPAFLTDAKGYAVETVLTFARDWGLGSSSTLINNIAHWANINAYELSTATFGGSGYDIACAQNDLPILYRIVNKMPTIIAVHENLPFKDSLFFVYLNQKKNSRDGINTYRKKNINTSALIEQITLLTRKMVSSSTIKEFEMHMTSHEELLSVALDIPTVKSELFSDFKGAIKSLGAWGGDFILASGNSNTPDYFKNKGYPVVLPFQKMIL